MTLNKINVTDKHRHALTRVIDAVGEGRFRRSDLSACIYPLTTPRSRERADLISDRVLREAAAAGQIRREGHQHWVKVGQGRRLIDGKLVPELPSCQKLVLDTKCPDKWLAVDLETGEVWRGSAKGWKRHAGQHRAAVSGLLAKQATK